MKWNQMSTIQKIMFVVGSACAAAWVVLAVLPFFGVGENTKGVRYALFGGAVLCWAVTEPKRKTRILWYILAAVEFLLSLSYFLMS